MRADGCPEQKTIRKNQKRPTALLGARRTAAMELVEVVVPPDVCLNHRREFVLTLRGTPTLVPVPLRVKPGASILVRPPPAMHGAQNDRHVHHRHQTHLDIEERLPIEGISLERTTPKSCSTVVSGGIDKLRPPTPRRACEEREQLEMDPCVGVPSPALEVVAPLDVEADGQEYCKALLLDLIDQVSHDVAREAAVRACTARAISGVLDCAGGRGAAFVERARHEVRNLDDGTVMRLDELERLYRLMPICAFEAAANSYRARETTVRVANVAQELSHSLAAFSTEAEALRVEAERAEQLTREAEVAQGRLAEELARVSASLTTQHGRVLRALEHLQASNEPPARTELAGMFKELMSETPMLLQRLDASRSAIVAACAANDLTVKLRVEQVRHVLEALTELKLCEAFAVELRVLRGVARRSASPVDDTCGSSSRTPRAPLLEQFLSGFHYAVAEPLEAGGGVAVHNSPAPARPHLASLFVGGTRYMRMADD